MSGLFGSPSLQNSPTKLEALTIQSSAYGVTIPVGYGVFRLPINVLWYGDFKAVEVKSGGGGKGGGGGTTSYDYSASLVMALCEGTVVDVTRAWAGKKVYSGGITGTTAVDAGETFTVPTGGGSYSVAYASQFASVIQVWRNETDIWGQNNTVYMTAGADYARSGGTFIFGPNLAGMVIYIDYQYTSGGSQQSALAQLGMSLKSGAVGQSPWARLATYTPPTPPGGVTGSQSIGYSGLAIVYAQDYALSSDGSLLNHTFEVVGQQSYSVNSSIPDANPSAILSDILTNTRYGASFPSSHLSSLTDFSTYCRAAGILLSPALTTQTASAEFVATLGKITNSAPVWSDGQLKMIPYGDTSITGNGVTFTPNVTPIYDLTDDDFISQSDPIKVSRLPQVDAFNHVRVEFLNRDNYYNVEIAEAKDSANIDAFGLRSAQIFQAHWICDADVARNVAQLMLQRSLYVRNTYAFTLPWTKALLEPMDLVTLTDSALGYSRLPVRIVSIEESSDNELQIEAEDFQAGVATAAQYASQVSTGYQHNYGIAPGHVSTPVIFEAPGALTQNGLELYVAAAGVDENWGGCYVWMSLDGTNYKQIGNIDGGSRYGKLTANATETSAISVLLVQGVLTSASSSTDAQALNTLCYIGGAIPEFFAYQTANLTGALAYTLSGNVRGAYLTSAVGVTHYANEPFVRVDNRLAKTGPIDLGYVGKTVYVKCTSYNIYGSANESLADVPAYTYSITGSQVLGNAGAAAMLAIANMSSDNMLTKGEKPAVILDATNIYNEKPGLDAQATLALVLTEKTAFDTAYDNLANYLINTIPTWSDLTVDTVIVGVDFRGFFAAYYAARQALVVAITNSAMTGINAASSDNVLSSGEKSTVIRDYAVITGEQSGIDTQATAYAITTEKTAYDAAITALTTYLATLTTPTLWNDVTGSTTIDGPTFRTKFANVYTAKQTLVDAIFAKSNNSAITVNPNGSLSNAGTGAPVLSQIAGTLVAGQISDDYLIINLNGHDIDVELRFNRTTGGPASITWNGSILQTSRPFLPVELGINNVSATEPTAPFAHQVWVDVNG